MKRVVSEFNDHNPRQKMGPPLTNLNHTVALGVMDQLAQADFAMPSYPQSSGAPRSAFPAASGCFESIDVFPKPNGLSMVDKFNCSALRFVSVML